MTQLDPHIISALVEARKLHLDTEDRHDLAEYLVGHEGSWATLNPLDARRIADALRAFRAVQWLYAEKLRGNPSRPALRRHRR